jgi:glutamine phosphoribosylpyrophosphate amidotransferase
MCGIIGVILGKKDRTPKGLEQIREQFATLLQNSEVRGVDAAGAFVVNPDEKSFYYKAPGPASQLTMDPTFWRLLDQLGNETVCMIGHTRAATHGSAYNIENDHPLLSGSIIGVHNGIIWNHEQLKKEHGDAGIAVDSQALFAHMRHLSEKDQWLETKGFRTVMDSASGVAAVAAVDLRRPEVLFVGRNTNPIVFRQHPKRELLWFASEAAILNETFGKNGKNWVAPPYAAARLTRKSAPKRYRNLVVGGFEDINWLPLEQPPVTRSRGWDGANWYDVPGDVTSDSCQFDWLARNPIRSVRNTVKSVFRKEDTSHE